jgi:hypothetical protein
VLLLFVRGGRQIAMDAATARGITARVVRESARETVLEVDSSWSLATARWFVEPVQLVSRDFPEGSLLLYKEAR